MRILFIQPNWFDKKEKKDIKSIHSVTPPLGVLYIAAVLREDGHKVSLIDALAEGLSIAEVVDRAVEAQPDMIALTATTPLVSYAFDIARGLREKLDVPIVLGGPHATAAPIESLKRCREIDYLVYGEGELTVKELVDALEKKRDASRVKGLYVRHKASIKFTGARDYIEDLDELPFPAREILRSMRLYSLAPSDVRREPSTTMITSRGCPFGCRYCNRAVFGKRYRCHSTKYVLSEIEMLIEKYHIREIKFWDDVFTINRKRTGEICDEIIKRKLDITWSCETRVDLVDGPLLKKMKSAGCWQIDYGVESGNQELIDRINKGIKLDDVNKAVSLSRKAGISTRGYFILGLPGETVKTAEKTIEFAIKSGLDYATFFVCVPYPGTELYEIAKKGGGIRTDDWRRYSHIDFEDLIYVPNTIPEKSLKALIARAYRRFYFRPGYIIKQVLNIRRPDEFRKKLNGALAILRGF